MLLFQTKGCHWYPRQVAELPDWRCSRLQWYIHDAGGTAFNQNVVPSSCLKKCIPPTPQVPLSANILGDSDSSCKMHFWFKGLNTTLAAFLFFSFVSRQLKFITVVTSECQIFSFYLFPMHICSHFHGHPFAGLPLVCRWSWQLLLFFVSPASLPFVNLPAPPHSSSLQFKGGWSHPHPRTGASPWPGPGQWVYHLPRHRSPSGMGSWPRLG